MAAQHIESMVSCLPHLYRDGALVRAVLGSPAVQTEILDEDMLEVQRAHWFDSTLELGEAAQLADLLGFAPEPWQRLDEFRAWVHAIRDARLKNGAVTKLALQRFVEDYTRRYQAAVESVAVPVVHRWSDRPSDDEAAFIENPPRRCYDRAPSLGGIEPLHPFSLQQRGLDETQAAFLLVGLPEGPEYTPVIVNRTSAQALVFLGAVPPGARLAIRPTPQGLVEAFLEGADVTAQLRSVSGVTPGAAWQNSQVEQPARAITLKRGRNDLWFLPVAHFDVLGLDRFLLALADLLLAQGRYDQSNFGQALFYQDPAVLLRLTWIETQPASLAIELPAGALQNRAGELEESLLERDYLEFSLRQALQALKPAGVSATLRLKPFEDLQGQFDRVVAVLPMVRREGGPTGMDRLPEAGGLFEVTGFEQSTFR